MSRVKTFDSTGLATAGRLYAGDLNAIQDQYADAYNLAQTLGLSVLVIGESGLQLIRYGAGEARLSGALRVDGILRSGIGGSTGGLLAPVMTTTQRNAIPSGFAPNPLMIFNSTTNQLEINLGTDAARNWQGVGSIPDLSVTTAKLADGAVTDVKVAAGAAIAQSKLATLVITDTHIASGALSPNRISGTAVVNADSRLSDARAPIAGSVSVASLSAALSVYVFPQFLTVGAFPPASPVDTQEVFLLVDSSNGVVWHLRYNAASGSAYKWEWVGGSYMFSEITTAQALPNSGVTTYQALTTAGPSITLPRAGDYEIEIGAWVNPANTQGGTQLETWMSYDIGGTGAVDADGIEGLGSTFSGNLSRARIKTGLTASAAIVAKYRHSGTNDGPSPGTFRDRWMRIRPVRIS